MYSSPPRHGSEIVKRILSDSSLKNILQKDVNQVVSRMLSMKQKLVEGLTGAVCDRDFSFLSSQKGMFCFTCLESEEVQRLKNDHHIYTTSNGRISIAGLNESNVEYVIESIAKVCSSK